MMKKIAIVENPQIAAEMVARGDVPAAVVFATDIHGLKGVRIAGKFPERSHARIAYPIAVTMAARHPQQAEAFAAHLPFLPDEVLALIRHHHERWDGAGYPDRLAGAAIPRAARIFAVCDVYDTLVSERPYKRAWTHAEAVTEIATNSGLQFDPEVVDAFLCIDAER